MNVMKNVKYLPHECFYIKTHILVIQSAMQATLKFVNDFFLVWITLTDQLLMMSTVPGFIISIRAMYANTIVHTMKLFFMYFYSTS